MQRFIPKSGENFSKGVIGVASSFLGRYREFDTALNDTIAPDRSRVEYRMGVNIAHHFNEFVHTALKGGYEWVWFLGDDHVWPQDLLIKLLARKVDIIIPLCLRRSEPFNPVLNKSKEDGNTAMSKEAVEWLKGKRGVVDLEGLTCGNAGALVSRKVFEKIKRPWFTQGQINPELGSPDLYFCNQAYDNGFKIYLDTDNPIGHITHSVIWPIRDKETGSFTHDLRTP